MFNEPGGEGGAQPGAEGGTGAGEGAEDKSFDDWLAENKEFQAEFDRRNDKAIKTAKTNWENTLPDLIKKEVEKQKSYDQLSDDEKKEKELQDEWAKIKEAQAEIERSNLVASIKSDLAEKGLPIKVGDFDFAEVFASLGDSEKALKAVNGFKEAHDKAIQEEVDKRLVGSVDVPGGNSSSSSGNEPGARGKALAQRTAGKQTESNFFKK